ncbi:MAG: flagellar M-ring protein FliF [Bryobacteraceae bacterium]|nr:flagellar M-ring protein FliF [Bryobacteraceae bacterium]
MEQLKNLFNRLSRRQKLTIAGAALAVIVGIIALARWNRERDFRPLYQGLAAEDAGAVVNRLRETGVEYRVTDGGSTILVPSSRVAEVRLQMAASGLPKTGRIGFELFDSTNFGVTDFTEQVNFRRAIEGELERSVMALSEVEAARVHVTFPKDSVFVESREPAKASVMVKLRAGAKLSPANVDAIAHLVASAVEGLQPEAVAILDMRGNLLSKRRRPEDDEAQNSEELLEFRKKMERDMLAKVHATLEPLLGPDRYRVGVSIDCDFTSGEQSEERYDPAASVILTSQRSEETSTGTTAASGVPGTASNMPRPAVRPGGGGTASVSRKTENLTYQPSRLVKRLRLPQGEVRRLSVAVLLDQDVTWQGTGPQAKRVLVPPSPERLKVIRDVVAGVVGLRPERGDQLTVETLPFESTLKSEPPPGPPPPPAGLRVPEWLERALKTTSLPVLIGIGAATLIVLIGLIAAVLIRSRRKRKLKVEMRQSVEAPSDRAELPSSETTDFGEQIEAQIADNAALQEAQEAEILKSLKAPPVARKTEALKKHLVEQASKDPVAMAQIVRTWLSEGDDR